MTATVDQAECVEWMLGYRGAPFDGIVTDPPYGLAFMGKAFDPRNRHSTRANTHPTVKPIDLMRWLCRLVVPEGGRVLDPFAGSGTTLIAAGLEGMAAHGVEMDAHYAEIARARIAHHLGGRLAL